MDSIKDTFTFDEQWILEQNDESAGVARWRNSVGDVLSLNFFDVVPDIQAELHDLSGLRQFYRNVAEQNGLAPIEIECVQLQGVQCIRTIFKAKLEPRGFLYVGSLTLPFSECSFVIKVQSAESGVTGMRESAVLVQEKSLTMDKATRKLIGWEVDPYDPNHEADFMANRADDRKYDAAFPAHPLTKVRNYLDDMQRNLKMPTRLVDLEPFTPGGRRESNPWWRFW